MRSILTAGAALAAVLLAAPGGTAVVGSTVEHPFDDTPYTFSFGPNGEASYTLSYINRGFFDPNPDGISTAGTARVAALGAPFYDPPQPTAFGAGGLIDGSFGNGVTPGYLPFASAAPVPFSLSDEFIGLSFTLTDGIHYGYAEVYGPTLLSYAFESQPGIGIVTGAAITAAVPEPASWAMMIAGFGLAGTAMRRRTRVRTATA